MTYRVSELYCVVCERATRYRHQAAICANVRCGKSFCRQRPNGKFCSDYCRQDVRNQRNAVGSRLRVERDEARRLAAAAWRKVGAVPDDAPAWLRVAVRNGGES